VQLLSTTCGRVMQELLAAAHHIIEAIHWLRPLLVLVGVIKAREALGVDN
jgi:hypothetical protein